VDEPRMRRADTSRRLRKDDTGPAHHVRPGAPRRTSRLNVRDFMSANDSTVSYLVNHETL
jgi:hypothetical protein